MIRGFGNGAPWMAPQSAGPPLWPPPPLSIQAGSQSFGLVEDIINLNLNSQNPQPNVFTPPPIPQPIIPELEDFFTPLFPDIFDMLLELPTAVQSKERLFKLFRNRPLAEQLEEFLRAVTLTEKCTQLRAKVMCDLTHSLRKKYPYCKLYPFGSIMTGLADSRSDIDVYVDLGVHFLTKMECFNATNIVLNGVQCPKTGTWLFSNVHPIRHTRVPIIKLEHAETGVKCDLSFENRISVQNTKLVAFYFKFNPQIMTLMKLLRYWAKYHGLIGSHKIKNYGLTLLVLVFLAENKIIPSVNLLQALKAAERARNGVTSNPDEIEGWDTSFSEDVGEIVRVFKAKPFPGAAFGIDPSKVSMLMALKFFKMYSELDLSTVVISPLFGRAMPKAQFHKINNRGFNDSASLSIQDPFVLNYNVGAVAHLETVAHFQVACASTAKHLESFEDNIECILDLFIPIPKDLGADKFEYSEGDPVQAQKLDVIRESKTALGLEMPFDIAFPPHLDHFKRRLNKDYLDNTQGNLFTLTSKFEKIFGEAVAPLWTNLGPEVQKLLLTKKLSTLWGQFAEAFLTELVKNGLKLKADFVKDGTVATGTRMGWKMSNFVKKEEDELSPEALKLLKDKVVTIGVWKPEIKYKVMNVEVTYPFWDLRRAKRAEVKADLRDRAANMSKMEIEAETSQRIWKAWTEIDRTLATDKPKVMFGFNIVVKLDLSLEKNQPQIFIILEKDNKTPNPHQDLGLCFQSLSEILNKTFSNYLKHQLRTWLSNGQSE